jgi:Tol biopolymer transport system component
MLRSLLPIALASAVITAQEPLSIRDVTLTLTEGTTMAAAASPDERWIAIDLVGSIWILPISGGAAKKITPDDLEARNPSWSPDGQSIAFQGFDVDGAWHIYVTGRNGDGLHAVTSGEFDDREPAWSHDGSRIAFSSDRSGGIIAIFEIVLSSGEVRQRSMRDGWMPSWGPNDRDVLFISRVRELEAAESVHGPSLGVYAVDRGGRERLVHVASAAAAAISPDGARLAVAGVNGTLEIVSIGRTVPIAPIRVPPNEDVFPSRPQWLSRTELLYAADGHVKRLSLESGGETIPFRATITLTRATYTIAHRPLEPTEVQPLRGIVNPVVSPDGRAVAFVALGDVWVMPIGTNAVQITNDEAMDLDPAWSPDGTRVVFSSDRSGHMELWVRDLATNSERQITDGEHRVTGAAWSPDGNHIAFLADRALIAVVTVRPDAHAMSGPTFVPRGALGRPTWSFDNHVIAAGDLFPYSDRYAHGLNQLLFVAMDPPALYSSLPFRSHSAGNRVNNGPVWSPDGFRFAFATEGKLWTVNVDGKGAATGPPSPIADDQPESPSWEGDSKHIVYQTPDGLRRVLSDGGGAESIPIDLAWKPSPPPERIVVHAGHLVDGVFDGLRGESDIVIERGIIREITDHRDDLHAGVVVDASEEVVMPGLIDTYARFDPEEGGVVSRTWLAYGVTSVRAFGAGARAALEARESFESGRRPGPRLFVSGERYDGIRQFERGGIAVTSDDQLDRELGRSQALDVDLLNTDVRLPGRYARRIIQFAHENAKPVVTPQIFPDVAYGADAIAALPRHAYADTIDAIAKSGVTIVPTLALRGEMEARLNGDRSLLFDRRLSLFPLGLVSRLTEIVIAPRRPGLDLVAQPYESSLKAIVAAGGKIAAGTEAPIVPHGLGLHVELESYVHAGLTPFQALQAATINAAQVLGCERELGTIEAGKLADLAFVGGDPLADIRNARDVKRVMKGGRVYTVTDLISGFRQ